jgi:hypothetical protein
MFAIAIAGTAACYAPVSAGASDGSGMRADGGDDGGTQDAPSFRGCFLLSCPADGSAEPLVFDGSFDTDTNARCLDDKADRACVVLATTVAINPDVPTIVTGSRSLAVFASEAINVSAGAQLDVLAGSAGGACVMLASAIGDGGAGGSFGTSGGSGGAGDAGTTSAHSSSMVPVPATLSGGCPGQSAVGSASSIAAGGAAGGGLLLHSDLEIDIAGTVDVSGGGGTGGGADVGGGGGGTGGMLILDAPEIIVDNTGIARAAGGGGGGGGADVNSVPISGKQGDDGDVNGGGGGAGAGTCNNSGGTGYQGSAAAPGAPGPMSCGGGGGGGGAGYIVTRTQQPITGGGLIEPSQTPVTDEPP